jgi:type IV pilus assembly protein PilA
MLTNKLSAMRAEKDADDRGFTLIELLVVVVIIGILIAIAIPLYLNYQKGAKDKSAQSDIRAAVSTVQQCYTDNANAYPAAPTGNGVESTSLVFTCGTGSETANVSSGTKLTYALATGGGSFTLSSTNTGGHTGKTYSYDSSTGGGIS